ncbi:MAG: CPBP family intramembrane glutamic endopeptidase [Candidatus Zixiibacteriota bacterium]
MKNQNLLPVLRLPAALAMGLAISAISLKAPGALLGSESSARWLPPAITHSVMWMLSILIIGILSKGELAEYGFARGKFQLTGRIFLWIIPTAILSVIGFIASRSGAQLKGGLGLNQVQSIIFVWIYATISEEIFTRGLLQSFLSPLARYGFNLSGTLRISLPVAFSGLYFGMMHIVAVSRMGPPVILWATLLGVVAGYYREKTESLIPALIIHALFNIGGSLPLWLLSWLI